jgi:hypothetical protein
MIYWLLSSVLIEVDFSVYDIYVKWGQMVHAGSSLADFSTLKMVAKRSS